MVFEKPQPCEDLQLFGKTPGGHIYTCPVCYQSVVEEYRIWSKIVRRINNPGEEKYGPGKINMCDLWINSFYSFFKNVGHRPSPRHKLKRILLDKPYEPGNCAWRLPGEWRNPDKIPNYLLPEYSVWEGMIQRCHNPKCHEHKWYGGKGIIICDRWRYSFNSFLADMGRRPEGFTIERYNVNGNYEPNNCGWEPRSVQARNRRSNRFVDTEQYGRITVAELSERTGILQHTIHSRIGRGIKDQDLGKTVVTVPKYWFNNKEQTLDELSFVNNVPASTIGWRIRKGWTVEDAVLPCKQPERFLHFGQWVTLREISDKENIERNTLVYRKKQGKRNHELIRKPSKKEMKQ